MLKVNQLTGFGVRRSSSSPNGSLDASQPIATAESATAEASSFNFGSLAIGTAGATRLVVAVVHWYIPGTNSDIALSSATIGGNTATIHVQAHLVNAAEECTGVAIISYPLTTGATAGFEITLSDDAEVAGLEVYAIYDLGDQSPFDTGSDVDNGFVLGEDHITSVSVDVPANGVLIAGGTGCFCDTGRTWSGMTEDYGENDFGDFSPAPLNGRRGSAAEDGLSATSGKVVSIDWDTTISSSMVAASWA